MTDATARREARLADQAGRCGFCGSTATTTARQRQRVVHRADCKLVCEHGGRVSLLSEGK
jgi:hypothetical protein